MATPSGRTELSKCETDRRECSATATHLRTRCSKGRPQHSMLLLSRRRERLSRDESPAHVQSNGYLAVPHLPLLCPRVCESVAARASPRLGPRAGDGEPRVLFSPHPRTPLGLDSEMRAASFSPFWPSPWPRSYFQGVNFNKIRRNPRK